MISNALRGRGMTTLSSCIVYLIKYGFNLVLQALHKCLDLPSSIVLGPALLFIFQPVCLLSGKVWGICCVFFTSDSSPFRPVLKQICNKMDDC